MIKIKTNIAKDIMNKVRQNTLPLGCQPYGFKITIGKQKYDAILCCEEITHTEYYKNQMNGSIEVNNSNIRKTIDKITVFNFDKQDIIEHLKRINFFKIDEEYFYLLNYKTLGMKSELTFLARDIKTV